MTKNEKFPQIYMDKNVILQKLKERGCRITKQRQIILDVILENEFHSCKEICCYVEKIDNTIGQATVYRMINTLEELGAISRKSIYKMPHLL